MHTQGGSTNSRPSAIFGTRAGVDTIRVRLRESNAAFLRLREQGLWNLGARGEHWQKRGSARVGVYPDGMVYVEGRAAAILSGDPDDHRLLEPGQLLPAAQAAVRLTGIAPTSEPTLGRADLAAEVRFARGDEGRAFLHGLASVNVPWCKVGVEGRKGEAIETVYGRSVQGKSILWRAYDKGVEAELAAPGELIRFERQQRFRKQREQTVAQYLAGDLRAQYVGRLEKLREIDEVVVCDVVSALGVLAGKDIPATRRDRLAGFLLFGAAREQYPRRTWYRLTAELRELGLAIHPAARRPVVVPVGRVLDVLASQWETRAAA